MQRRHGLLGNDRHGKKNERDVAEIIRFYGISPGDIEKLGPVRCHALLRNMESIRAREHLELIRVHSLVHAESDKVRESLIQLADQAYEHDERARAIAIEAITRN